MAYKTFANGFPLPASDLNNYLMNQSVIVFANSTARDAALPTPTEGMLTYLEDTNNYQYWDATWQDLVAEPDLSTLIPKSTVTTAGDLIVADGASSVTRLGVGTDGSLVTVAAGSPAYLAPGTDDQVLTLASGAPVWADAGGGGGLTLLATVSSVTSNVTFTSFTGYKDLVFDLDYLRTNGAEQINVSTNAGDITLAGVNGGSSYNGADNRLNLRSNISNGGVDMRVEIFNYADSVRSPIVANGMFRSQNNAQVSAGSNNSTSAITSVSFTAVGTFFTGGSIKLYGRQ